MRPPVLFDRPAPQPRNLGLRNARSIAIDLKTERGKDVFRHLVEKADAIQEGFRPGVVERLGIGYEAVRKVKPDIVYASITGYGRNGPYAQRVGHDLNYLSIAGFIDMNGKEGGPPVIPGTVVADFAAGGMSAAIHILAALLRRATTGEGSYADVSMTDAVFEINSMLVGGYLSTGVEPRRGQTLTSGYWPWYNVYETKDGRFVSIASVEPWFYEQLCKTLEREDILGEQWSLERREQTQREFAALFRSKTRDEWVRAFEGVEACFAPVQSIAEAVDDPQIRARNMVFEAVHPVHGKVTQVGSMLKFNGETMETRGWEMAPGESTGVILKEHGFSPDEIGALRAESIVA